MPPNNPRPSVGSTASRESTVSCLSTDSFNVVNALCSAIPNGWDVRDEVLVRLPDCSTALPRLRFVHDTLPDKCSLVVGQGFGDYALCYSFYLVHDDINEEEGKQILTYHGMDPQDLEDAWQHESILPPGIDRPRLEAALDRLIPWLEAADDYIVFSLPDLYENELPFGSIPVEIKQKIRAWFNPNLPYSWFIVETTNRGSGDKELFYWRGSNDEDDTPACWTQSYSEMRRMAFNDSIDNPINSHPGLTLFGDTTQEWLEELGVIEGDDNLSEDSKDTMHDMVKDGYLPDGPSHPPPGSYAFERPNAEESIVFCHHLLPVGWMMVRHPVSNHLVYANVVNCKATYIFQSVVDYGLGPPPINEFYSEEFIDRHCRDADDGADDGTLKEDSQDGGGIGEDTVELDHLTNASQGDRAAVRKRLGMSRMTGEEEERPKKRGKTESYPLAERERIIEAWDGGYRPRHLKSSVSRWKKRICRYLPTGNKARPGLSGTYQFLLVLFKLAYPAATAEEVIVFIAENAPKPKIFSPGDVSGALKRLRMSRKKGSTDATQAFTQTNMLKREIFWTTEWPSGVKGIPRRELIDADECGIELRHTNRKYGHAVKNCRVRMPGNYTRDTKFTVLLGIEAGDPSIPDGEPGSIANPRRYVEINRKPGTTSIDYHRFVTEKILKSFGEGEPRRTLMHDNLGSHLDPALYDELTEAGHRAICRPPWVPSDGPIEWAFNALGCELRNRSENIESDEDLIREIRDILMNMKGMDELFAKCGY